MSFLKFAPAGKDYLWGGTRLINEYGKKFTGDKLAETWELSCHPDGPCIIRNGDYVGRTLIEYIEKKGKGILGTKCQHMEQFPLLIKFIDAKKDLSIQVHPSDAYALKQEGQYGKTEVWYIMDSQPGSYIYYGFRKKISKEEFEERIRSNTLLEVLNKVPTKKGDVFFIPPGTLHAIGAGNLIAEIQQNSNVTYRVYDYGRIDKDGKQRELHIEKALEVTQCVPPKDNYDFGNHLVSCEFFSVDKVSVCGEYGAVVDDKSFVSILVLEGKGMISTSEEMIGLSKGDSIFIEAGSGEFILDGELEMLVSRV